ncbi:hypothetical protein TrVE_jg2033 [Triparma verrucosa]|uniref:Uncharacterized protein n=1 Tax=Triparma verrucosa TaxID=1606542 RepID=A0A9W7C1R4_9STRA|nr:hypothetical protein TrVE_jg2033 [Triparma verrucosa]
MLNLLIPRAPRAPRAALRRNGPLVRSLASSRYPPISTSYLPSGFSPKTEKEKIIKSSLLNDEIFQSHSFSAALALYHSSKNLPHFTTVNLTTTLLVLRKNAEKSQHVAVHKVPGFMSFINDVNGLLERTGFEHFKIRSIAEVFKSYSYFGIYCRRGGGEGRVEEFLEEGMKRYLKECRRMREREVLSTMIIVGVLVRESPEVVKVCSPAVQNDFYNLLDFFSGKEFANALVKHCKRERKVNEIIDYVKLCEEIGDLRWEEEEKKEFVVGWRKIKLGRSGWKAVNSSAGHILNRCDFVRVVNLFESGLKAGMVLEGIASGLEGREDKLKYFLASSDGNTRGRVARCFGMMGRGGKVWNFILEEDQEQGGGRGFLSVEDIANLLWGVAMGDRISNHVDAVKVLLDYLEMKTLAEWEGEEGEESIRWMLSDFERALEWEGVGMGEKEDDGEDGEDGEDAKESLAGRVRRYLGEVNDGAHIDSLPRGIWDLKLRTDASPEYAQFLRRDKEKGARNENEIATSLRKLGLDCQSDYRIVEKGGLNVCEDERDLHYVDAVHTTSKKVAFLRGNGGGRGSQGGGESGRLKWKVKALEKEGFQVVVVGDKLGKGGEGGDGMTRLLKEKLLKQAGINLDAGLGPIIRYL